MIAIGHDEINVAGTVEHRELGLHDVSERGRTLGDSLVRGDSLSHKKHQGVISRLKENNGDSVTLANLDRSAKKHVSFTSEI